MSVGLKYDGSYTVFDDFKHIGLFQYSQQVVVSGNDVEISTRLQKNYNLVECQSVTFSRLDAIAAARAILKHFGEGLE